MKLYDCSTAPSPQRVRIFLAEKGVDIPLVPVNLREGEQLGEAFRKINPDCTVPVLELDDGTMISEIFAICQYLESQYPEPALMGRNSVEQAMVAMWNTKIEQNGIVALAEILRNRAKGMQDRALTGPINLAQIPQLVDRGRTRAVAFFDRLDDQLENGAYVTGEQFSMADITAYVMVEFGEWSKIAIKDSQTNLQRWYDTVSKRPGMRA
ncbi:MAG: glutathione S-transferase family protein [Gammaproteobacteria bacterium]|nr:glutathione S-transferase family protein [Gammaproteobacteria bacterium]